MVTELEKKLSAATTDAAPADRDGNNSDLAELLRTVPLFSRLQEDRLDKLANLLSTRRFAAGDMVTRKGEDSTFMLILISGRVEVYDELNGRAVPLTTQEAGSSIGELGLIDSQPRSANVRALEQCQTLILERENFASLAKKDPYILWGLVRNLSERLRQSSGTIAQLSGVEQASAPLEQPVQDNSPRAEAGLTPNPAASAPPPAPNPAASVVQHSAPETDRASEEEETETTTSGAQGLADAFLGLGSTSFVCLTSALLVEGQRQLHLLSGKSSLGETLEKQEKILGAVTETVEAEMDQDTKKLYGRIQDLLSSLASLLDN